MAPKYAKDQPAGFTNRIERVAIVGASGQVGKPIVEALLRGGKHQVTAITRADSSNKIPEGLKAAPVNYDDESTIVEALKGQQFLIISLATTAPADTQTKLINAAAKAGVPYVMPNTYCPDIQDEKFAKEYIVGGTSHRSLQVVKDAGVSSFVALICGFWYEYSLSIYDSYGIDFVNKKAVFFDDGNTKINTSTWKQCGTAVANFLSLKELPEDENDKSPAVANWANGYLYTSSFLVSQRDMLDSVHRVLGDTDADWTIEKEPATERYTSALEAMKSGDRLGYVRAMYTRVFYPSGEGNVQARYGLANEALNLPVEDLDKATKRSIDWVKSGWNPFSNRVEVNIYDE